ncbi:MAG: sigma-70 family RNA polymerase sigma factor [Planctomycetes bacterium]|nr:sigma-70 family RNA polymerase sigma factor [Planctomycetota bacterium]
MQATSLTLLDRLRQPNPTEAWNQFAQLYTPLLIVWAKGLGLQDADAADLAQDVLLKVMRVLPTYQRKPGEMFRGWLFAVARNEAADFRRRRATRPLPGPDGLSGAAENAPEVSDADYRAHLVHRALELIRPDFGAETWAAFAGLMLENRPAAEVAAATGLTPNAVYLARHRVLTRLREELGDVLS